MITDVAIPVVVVAATVVFPNVVATGFGAYLANMLIDFGAKPDGWRYVSPSSGTFWANDEPVSSTIFTLFLWVSH